jgi:hypothetical protein
MCNVSWTKSGVYYNSYISLLCKHTDQSQYRNHPCLYTAPPTCEIERFTLIVLSPVLTVADVVEIPAGRQDGLVAMFRDLSHVLLPGDRVISPPYLHNGVGVSLWNYIYIAVMFVLYIVFASIGR